MNPEYSEQVEALRKRLQEDLRGDRLRNRSDYLREFPGLESEIDAEFGDLDPTVASPRGNQEGHADEATRVSSPPESAGNSPRDAGRIGRYVLEKELGRGGQGQVYLARDSELGREVALKVLSHGHALSPMARLRFKGEAEKAAKINHPNIARIYEWGEENDVPFIAMEFIRGETLAAHISSSARVAKETGRASEFFIGAEDDLVTATGAAGENNAPRSAEKPRSKSRSSASTHTLGRRATFQIAKLIESAARGLHAAHERGLVHRDIKPGNLVVTPDRGLVILDFGLAADEEDAGTKLTMTGDVMGTPSYMSPEQARGDWRHVDARTDIYALGVTLFECLALRKPFEAPSMEALFQDILTREAPDLRKINPRVPADLAVIVQHAIEKGPDQRYASALELAEDLRRFREHEPILARPVGPLTRSWRWAQRNPAVAGLLTTVFLALMTITVLTSLNSRKLGRLNASLASANTQLEETSREAKANAKRATENAARAKKNEQRAIEEAKARTAALTREQSARAAESKALAEKSSALAEYERMADARRLSNAAADADDLWPVHPDLVPQLKAWEEKYTPLFSRFADHLAALESLRDRAPRYTDEERARDFAPELARIEGLETRIPALREEAAAEENALEKEVDEELAAKLEAELSALRTFVTGRVSWDFGEDVDLQFRHDALTKLVADLDAFTDEETGVVASVSRRFDRSLRIRKESLEDRAALWKETIARIASNPRYASLSMTPQLGLIPLGADKASGLEEFLDWRTHDWSEDEGALPERDNNGRIEMTEGRGIIFVLIPGGEFWMGAQSDDPLEPNHDPMAQSDESPVRQIALSPYFISKYEMTQGQWRRGMRTRSSLYGAGGFNKKFMKQRIDRRHPVEQVSWNDATEAGHRLSFVLPTEAQWERAARGDDDPSTTWTGTSDLKNLHRFANIAGREGKDFLTNYSPEHEDRFVLHAPVGSFEGNSFGLFDTTGNVWELCRDTIADYSIDPEPGDGLRRSSSTGRLSRGGSFSYSADLARLAQRYAFSPSAGNYSLGLRPARVITTE